MISKKLISLLEIVLGLAFVIGLPAIFIIDAIFEINYYVHLLMFMFLAGVVTIALLPITILIDIIFFPFAVDD